MEIYVGNLPPNIQMQDLNYLFQYYGRILFIDIKNRCPPQFAFILFDNIGSAFNAVQASQNLVYNGYKLQVKLLKEEPSHHDKPSAETNVTPQNTLPQGRFQQMPVQTTQFPNQLAERDKKSGKKKNLQTQFHRTLTIVEQTVVPTEILKRDKSQATNNIQNNDVTQTPTIKILTPEVLNNLVIDKEKSKQLKKVLPKVLKKRSHKILPTPPAGMPGGLDDPYRKGLTGAGIKWYLRYLLIGIPKGEARIKAGAHKYLARGISEKEARHLSEKSFTSTFIYLFIYLFIHIVILSH